MRHTQAGRTRDAEGAMATTSVTNAELQEYLWAIFGRLPEPKLTRETTALLCIDIQYVDAHPDYGLGAKAKDVGVAGFLDYYWDQVDHVVVPNVQRLQAKAREKGVELIHIHVAACTADGRDSTLRYKALGLRTPRDTKEAQFLEEVAPQGDELVISKVTSSAFNSTNIDR